MMMIDEVDYESTAYMQVFLVAFGSEACECSWDGIDLERWLGLAVGGSGVVNTSYSVLCIHRDGWLLYL